MFPSARRVHSRIRAVCIGVRTTLVFSCISSRRSNGLTTSAATRCLRLCAFRGRSRHTYGFEPLDSFTLPLQELLAATEGKSRARLRPTRGSDVFQWLESSVGDVDLAERAARCTLLHGVFEVWGHGRNQEEAALNALKSGRVPPDCVDVSWSLGVTSYGRSNLSKAQEQTLAGGCVEEYLSTSLKGQRTDSSSSDIRIRIIEDTCPPPAENLPKYVRIPSWAAGATRESRFYICREIQAGAAVGRGVAMGMTCRRPVRGVLSTLALNKRRSRGPTAIEPEVALVMANLAKVRPGSLVLDPFCGSCSLLLPASFLGATSFGADVAGPATAASALEEGTRVEFLPGTEALGELGAGAGANSLDCETKVLQADREDLEGIRQDFRELELAPPILTEADVADEESPIRRPNFYDAIVTDPPYNVKERVFTKRAKIAPISADDRGIIKATSMGHVGSSDSHLPPKQAAHTECSSAERSALDEHSPRLAKFDNSAANDLVHEVVIPLLMLARCSLKPGGRLCFFLPVRGAEARLDRLPGAVLETLTKSNARGERLTMVFSSKQRMTSPNMCRWLLVLEKRIRMVGGR